MTNEELNAIEQRASRATAGEIDVHRYDDDEIRYQLQSTKVPFIVLGASHDGDGSRRAKFDAELWSHARVDVLALIAEVRRLRALTAARDAVVAAAVAWAGEPDQRARGDVALREAVRRLREVEG